MLITNCAQCGNELKKKKIFGRQRYYCNQECALQYKRKNRVGFHANLPTYESDRKFKNAKK